MKIQNTQLLKIQNKTIQTCIYTKIQPLTDFAHPVKHLCFTCILVCFALKYVLVCTLQMLLYIRHNTLYFLCTSLYVFLHFFILCTSMHVANVFMHPKQHLHQARPGKQIFYKKGPKNRLFRGDTIQVMSLRRELEAKPVRSGQLLGHP